MKANDLIHVINSKPKGSKFLVKIADREPFIGSLYCTTIDHSSMGPCDKLRVLCGFRRENGQSGAVRNDYITWLVPIQNLMEQLK